MVHIVTDSSSDIPKYIADELGITVLPARILFGRSAYRDGIDIDIPTFYSKLRTTKYHPVTTPTAPDHIHSILKNLEATGEDILIITLPEALSLFQESIKIALKDIHQVQTKIIDSTGTSMYQGLLVIQAAKLANLGLGLNEIAEEVKLLSEGTILYAIVDNLEYLVRGGRISVARQKLGNILKINPILEVNNSEVEATSRAKGMIKGIDETIRLLDEQYNKTTELLCSVMHSENPIMAARMTQLVKENFTIAEFIQAKIGPTIGANVGPYSVGVAFSPVSRYFNGVDPEKYKLRDLHRGKEYQLILECGHPSIRVNFASAEAGLGYTRFSMHSFKDKSENMDIRCTNCQTNVHIKSIGSHHASIDRMKQSFAYFVGIIGSFYFLGEIGNILLIPLLLFSVLTFQSVRKQRLFEASGKHSVRITD